IDALMVKTTIKILQFSFCIMRIKKDICDNLFINFSIKKVKMIQEDNFDIWTKKITLDQGNWKLIEGSMLKSTVV
ncbi:hypothetical protein ACJX0J_030987, partial [Zea mays]